ncbi:2-phospho-L-lactate guanylyltransferase [Georgfuchsia toluolica]|uniref:3-phospho-D-glycerate guanylyltransferase n=1 Tax=Georgfuchsia toluolica TaxID=424218 RepID=A0A916J5M1_9PROT|nr:2-phospho-L-lactate guanylyltransferase [Georgfuchsia toluolica]CAG4883620.1 2-phospho-L-lactate guanylyltransferase [Georgfuchsia toluolica]
MKQIWALIPLKNFARAKTRLAGALGAEVRRALTLAMARDVVAALASSRAVTRVILVSDIPHLENLIDIDGVGYFNTGLAQGLNEDLTTAARWAGTQGATDVLIAHGDLPQLTSQAIDRFILGAGRSTEYKVRAAACKEGSGTNLLFAPLPLPLPLVFGKNSLAGFHQAAAEAGMAIEVVRDSVLETDIDELADLKALAAAHARGEFVGAATAALLLSTMKARPTTSAAKCSKRHPVSAIF